MFNPKWPLVRGIMPENCLTVVTEMRRTKPGIILNYLFFAVCLLLLFLIKEVFKYKVFIMNKFLKTAFLYYFANAVFFLYEPIDN